MFALASLQVRIVANANWVDYLIIGLYFAVTLGIGFALRTRMRSSEDFFLIRSFTTKLGHRFGLCRC